MSEFHISLVDIFIFSKASDLVGKFDWHYKFYALFVKIILASELQFLQSGLRNFYSIKDDEHNLTSCFSFIYVVQL